MNLEKEAVLRYVPVSPIDGLIVDAQEAGAVVSEIGVWESDTICVEDGEVGILATDQLNGCHVTVIVAAKGSGYEVLMTHFPPEIGAARYKEALRSLSTEMQPTTIVTFTASERPAPECELPMTLFPGANVHSLQYEAKNPKRARQLDAGRCVAIIDNESQKPSLHVITDSGDTRIFLSQGDCTAIGINSNLLTFLKKRCGMCCADNAGLFKLASDNGGMG